MRKELEKRLSYLYTGESIAIVGFIIVSFLLNKANPQLQLYSLTSFWVSFFPFGVSFSTRKYVLVFEMETIKK